MVIFARNPRPLGPSSLVLALLLLLLVVAGSDAFSSEAFRRPTRQQQQPQQQPNQRNVPYSAASVALEQASVALPEYQAHNDKDDDLPLTNNRLQRLRLRAMKMRGVGRTLTTTPKEGSLLKRHPFASAVSITTVNAILADLLAQLFLITGSSSSISGTTSVVWDWKRTAVFGVFGCFYQGMVQYAIVNGVWEKVFPGTRPKAVVAKICAMNLLSDPLLFMPTFYIFQQVMTTSSSSLSVVGTIQAALCAYRGNCFMDWRNSWMVWFPGHAVTYGVMPCHQRIPWMACLSFFYMCILSLTRG